MNDDDNTTLGSFISTVNTLIIHKVYVLCVYVPYRQPNGQAKLGTRISCDPGSVLVKAITGVNSIDERIEPPQAPRGTEMALGQLL